MYPTIKCKWGLRHLLVSRERAKWRGRAKGGAEIGPKSIFQPKFNSSIQKSCRALFKKWKPPPRINFTVNQMLGSVGVTLYPRKLIIKPLFPIYIQSLPLRPSRVHPYNCKNIDKYLYWFRLTELWLYLWLQPQWRKYTSTKIGWVALTSISSNFRKKQMLLAINHNGILGGYLTWTKEGMHWHQYRYPISCQSNRKYSIGYR